MTARTLWGSCHFVRWDEFRWYLEPIELPSDPFVSNDALDMGIEAFTNTLGSAKIAGTVRRPHEAIQHFPDLSELVAEKCHIRRCWQWYKQYEDKIKLNRLTNLIHDRLVGLVVSMSDY